LIDVGLADVHHDAEAVARDAEDEASVYVPAGFVATIPHSGKPTSEATDRPQRAHRTVVLPEFQGFGVGARLSDAVGEWLKRRVEKLSKLPALRYRVSSRCFEYGLTRLGAAIFFGRFRCLSDLPS
jgi:GNAT superfamily N-acetyltransferase